MHLYQLDKTRIRTSRSNLLFSKTPEVVSSCNIVGNDNIKHSGVVLSAHGRIITAMETGGLHYMMTLHTLFFRIFKILHVLCLSLSSHYSEIPTGFQTSSGRALLVELILFYKLYPTTAGLNAGVTNQRQSKYMQHFNNSKK